MKTMIRIRVIRLLLYSAVLLASLALRVEASVAWGSINNFDTVNDTGGECHGFLIEIQGIHNTDVTYTYDWNHYGVPRITEDNSDPAHPKVFIRYAGVRNVNGTWSAFTAVPAGPISPTDGHQFTNPSVNFGGEHFGVGYYGAPTAVIYSWLKDDGAGNLVFAGAVNIATPTFNYNPPAPARPAEVVAAIVPPPPPPEVPVLQFGPASWVKETKTKTHNNRKVELRDLVSDDPDDPNDRNWRNGEPDEVEVEWKIIQTEFARDDGGKNGKLEGAPEELPEGDEIITRRYDFFKYVGPVDAESGEAMADEVGPDGIHGRGTVTYNDHVDPVTGEWVEVTVDLSEVVIVGDYVGAQMAGFDAGAQIGLVDHLQDGERNVPYVDRTLVIGGMLPIVTTRTGPLPDGMIFDEITGILSGTPLVSGTFTFQIHSVDANGGDVTATYHLTILEPAIVEPPHITVTTTALPAGGGTTAGAGEWLTGETVTVVASPNPGFSFLSWSEGGTLVSLLQNYQFTANVNRDLVANFSRITYTITVSASPVQGGSAIGGTVNSGDLVTIFATANPGYKFVSWTEGGVVLGSSASYSFTANANRTFVANFALLPRRGDVNNDGAINSADLALIVAARNKPATGPDDPRDLDRDGKITVLDARIEAILINQANP